MNQTEILMDNIKNQIRVFIPGETHEPNEDFNGQSHKPNKSFYIRKTHKPNKYFNKQSFKQKDSFYWLSSQTKQRLLTKNILQEIKNILCKLQYYPCTKIQTKNLTDIFTLKSLRQY